MLEKRLFIVRGLTRFPNLRDGGEGGERAALPQADSAASRRNQAGRVKVLLLKPCEGHEVSARGSGAPLYCVIPAAGTRGTAKRTSLQQVCEEGTQ